MIVTLGRTSCPFTPWKPTDGRVFDRFAFDCETTRIDEDRPELVPAFVIGAACDGQKGVFVPRSLLRQFFDAHAGVPVAFHNAAFDLGVIDQTVAPGVDVYAAVEKDLVLDTMVLHRLYRLAAKGHTARGESSLEDCARTYLGVDLPKDDDIRLTFDRFLNRPPAEIPQRHLEYLAKDVLTTRLIAAALCPLVDGVLSTASGVWGFHSGEWLAECSRRFGPLTHNIQLRASILMDALGRNGIGIDRGRRDEKVRRLGAVRAELLERLRHRGYLPGEPGNQKALQSILSEFYRKHLQVERHKTDSGEQWSTKEEHLDELMEYDEFFRDLVLFRGADKLLQTYVSKMGCARLHPTYLCLLATGRTACGGGFNLQNLPKEKSESDAAATVRGCFVPADDQVFIDADYSQIELVAFAHAVPTQFGIASKLAGLINSGADVHRLLAGTVLGKPLDAVTKDERDSAKAISFGRLGGMGAECLRRLAKNNYGIVLAEDEVAERIRAYHRLCPELDIYLQDDVDGGLRLSEMLGLTPAAYDAAVGRRIAPGDPDAVRPAGWLGGMMLKVLADPAPVTRRGEGRPYTPEEISYFWRAAAPLAERLDKKLRRLLVQREPSPALARAVRDLVGRRPVFTATGRLRANATYSAARNCVFQGLAADGAILGMWRVWRAGYKVVAFVHDQLVVEVPADDQVVEHARAIERLMVEGMHEVLPTMQIKVDVAFTRSLNKKDRDPQYDMAASGVSVRPIAA
jgi:DNA polymerase I-like protein with 3'-5' exonuclease and polymerase domains